MVAESSRRVRVTAPPVLGRLTSPTQRLQRPSEIGPHRAPGQTAGPIQSAYGSGADQTDRAQATTLALTEAGLLMEDRTEHKMSLRGRQPEASFDGSIFTTSGTLG